MENLWDWSIIEDVSEEGTSSGELVIHNRFSKRRKAVRIKTGHSAESSNDFDMATSNFYVKSEDSKSSSDSISQSDTMTQYIYDDCRNFDEEGQEAEEEEEESSSANENHSDLDDTERENKVLEEIKEPNEDSEDSVEDDIFNRDLRNFSTNMQLNITKESSLAEQRFLESFYTFIKLSVIIGAQEGQNYLTRLKQVEIKLKEINRDRRDGTWTLSLKDKRPSAELLLEALYAISNRKVKESFIILEEVKKRAEKEFQNAGENVREKTIYTRFLIFADSLLVSYSQEANQFLPLGKLTEDQSGLLLHRLKANVLKLHVSVFRRKSDTLRRKGSKPIKEMEALETEYDMMLRDVYFVISETSQASSPSNFLTRHTRYKLKLFTNFLPEKEECCVGICIGNYLLRSLWAQNQMSSSMELVGGTLEDEFSRDHERVVDFKPVYCFLWKKHSNICIRSKATQYEIPNSFCKGNALTLELTLDEQYDIYQLFISGSDEEEVEGVISVPNCCRKNLMEEAQSGQMRVETYQEIERLGLFYLREAHNFRLSILDRERRTLLHYAAWIGQYEVVDIITKLMPSLIGYQDEYGETALMLAVKGGKACLTCVRLLIHSPLNIRNSDGQTALHLAMFGIEPVITETLLKAGASYTIKDKDNKLPSEIEFFNQQAKKQNLSLLKKYSRNSKFMG